MNFLGVGLFELVVIAGLAYFFLGPKKLGEAGRTVGRALRELRRQRDQFAAMLTYDADDEELRSSRPQAAAPDSDNGDGPTRRPDQSRARPRRPGAK